MGPARSGGRRGKLHRTDLAAITVAVGLLAFGVRLAWLLGVQSPYASVYSDMAGYVSRADGVFHGFGGADPRGYAFYPWGTHVLLALEFAVVGRNAPVGIAVVHAAVSTLTAVFTPLLTARIDPRPAVVAVAGVAVALWQPQIACAGFFMSEMWFSAALMVGAWLAARSLEHRPGALGAGSAVAIAFVVRPQVLLTCGLVGLALLPRLVDAARRGGLVRLARLVRRHAWAWGRFAVPLSIALVFSASRLHQLSGRLGLISENGAVMRLFADTDVGKIEASWEGPNGGHYSAWYSPGTKQPLQEKNIARFHGYVGDPDILERIRRERLRGVSLTRRARRMVRNVALLWNNRPNPEEDFRGVPRRAFLQGIFAQATLVLLPLAALGAWKMRRSAGGIVVIANLLTILVVAAVYFAESRYRVPYDPFLVVAATVGAASLARVVRAGGGHRPTRWRWR